MDKIDKKFSIADKISEFEKMVEWGANKNIDENGRDKVYRMIDNIKKRIELFRVRKEGEDFSKLLNKMCKEQSPLIKGKYEAIKNKIIKELKKIQEEMLKKEEELGGEEQKVEEGVKTEEKAAAQAPLVSITPCCGGKFHKQCLVGWLKKDPTCPICRASLKDAKIEEVRLPNSTEDCPICFGSLAEEP